MKYLLTVRPEAESDISETFSYYEEQRLGLGHDYLLCVEETISRVSKKPLLYQKVHKELRRALVKRFPHCVFFLIQDNKVVVTAVFHARRDPALWDDRIQ